MHDQAWIARSDWNWGTLDQLDPVTGAPQRRYEIAPGIEGIAFGDAGRLWAVSEAGSRHIYDHPFLDLFQPFFPLVFALDLAWSESDYMPPPAVGWDLEILWGGRRDFLPGSQEVKWRDGNPATNAAVAAP
jgi:hypothetical protein